MLVRIKEDIKCADCGVSISVDEQKNNIKSVHKTSDGALVCKDCFFEDLEDVEG